MSSTVRGSPKDAYPSARTGRGYASSAGEGLSWRTLLPYALIILLPLVFFARYLGGRVVPFGDDILLLNYPLLSLIAHSLHAGHPVLWNPYSAGGYPLAPFSALPFYAPTWLLDVLPVTTAMSWTYALDLIIGGLGAYALAARLGVQPAARLVPAIAFPFSGFVLAHLYAGHFLEVGLICWFPAALAALHWAIEAPALRAALRRGVICGGPLGMLILANGVSWLVFVAYPLGLVALALLARAAWTARRGGRAALLGALARPLVALLGAGSVAALLGASVLLPLREIVGQSVRGGAMSYHAITRISEPALGLAMAVAPGLFGADPAHSYWFPNGDAYFQEVYAYIGLPVLALALAGAIAGRRRRNVPLYAALALLGVALALGANTPLYAALYRVAPGLDLARVPARWLLLSIVAVAALAGVGADALLASARCGPVSAARPPQGGAALTAYRGRIVPLALAALAVLLALGLLGIALAAALPAAARHGATIGPALLRLLVLALATVLALLAAPQLPRPAGATVLLALVLADLWSANGPLVRPLAPAPYYQGAAVDLAHAREGAGRVWALDRAIPLRLGMLDRRTRDVQDFAPLTLLDYWLFTHPGHTLAGVDTGAARAIMGRYNARLAVLLGVSLVIAPHPLHDRGLVALARLRVPRWGLLNGDWSHPGPHPGVADAYRVPAALPFALPIYSTHTARGRVPLAAVFATGFDPRRVALLDGGSAPQPARGPLFDAWRNALTSLLLSPSRGDGEPGRRSRGSPLSRTGRGAGGEGIALLGGTENSVTLNATMRRAGVLLVDQVYNPAWTATVDGRPVALRRADYLLTALPLAAGRHTITLVYAPLSFAAGAALSLLGYLLLLGGLLTGLRRKTKSAGPG